MVCVCSSVFSQLFIEPFPMMSDLRFMQRPLTTVPISWLPITKNICDTATARDQTQECFPPLQWKKEIASPFISPPQTQTTVTTSVEIYKLSRPLH